MHLFRVMLELKRCFKKSFYSSIAKSLAPVLSIAAGSGLRLSPRNMDELNKFKGPIDKFNDNDGKKEQF